MQQGYFIDVFLARHVLGTYAHHQQHQMLSCNSTPNAPDDKHMYPKHVELRIH